MIARLVPGAMLVAVLSSAAGFPDLTIPAQDDPVRKIVFFAVFAAAAYSAGLTVSALSWILSALGWFVVYPILKYAGSVDTLTSAFTRHSLQAPPLAWANPLVAMDVFARAHDHIKAHAHEERGVVMKLAAEVTLLYSLTIAFLVVGVCMKWPARYFVVPLALFTGGIIRSVRTWQRHATILLANPTRPLSAQPEVQKL